jgi:hypothetical protein
MEITHLKYPNGERLFPWEIFFLKLGWNLSKSRLNGSIVPLITAGFFQHSIRSEYENRLSKYRSEIEKKIEEDGGSLSSSYIWSGKKYKGVLKKAKNGFKFTTIKGRKKSKIDIHIKKKFILKIGVDKVDPRFSYFDPQVKKFIEEFYDIANMEYLNSIPPVEFEIWGSKKKHKKEFDREVKVADLDYSGKIIELLGITGKRGGNLIDNYLVSASRLTEKADTPKDLVIFDKGVTYLKGSNLINSNFKIIITDSFDSHLDELKREFINQRMHSASDIKLDNILYSKMPSGVEIAGFKG